MDAKQNNIPPHVATSRNQIPVSKEAAQEVSRMTHDAEQGNGIELSRLLEEIPPKQWAGIVSKMMEMNQLHVDVSMKINDHLDYVAKRAGAPPPLDPPSGYDGGSAYGKVYHTPVPPLLSNQVDHHDGNEILTIYQGNGARRLPLATVKGYLPHH